MVPKQVILAMLSASLLCFLTIGCNTLPKISQELTDPGKELREKKRENIEAVAYRRIEAQIKAARARFDDQDFSGSQTLIKDVLKKSPENLQALSLLAEIAVSEDLMDEALSIYRYAITLSPDNPKLHHDLATILELTGRPNEARIHFEEANRLAPNNRLYQMSLMAESTASNLR